MKIYGFLVTIDKMVELSEDDDDDDDCDHDYNDQWNIGKRKWSAAIWSSDLPYVTNPIITLQKRCKVK